MSRNARKAEKNARLAEQDLIDAKAWMEKPLVHARRMGRRMAREAKRRRSKAERRAARAQIEDLET